MLVNHSVNFPECQGNRDRVRTELGSIWIVGRKQKPGQRWITGDR